MIGDKPGYRQPPKFGQFKKGQSGNPRGRPKKTGSSSNGQALSTEAYLRERMNSVVNLKTPTGSVAIPVKEAVVQKLIALGLAGNRIALENLMKLMRQWERQEAEAEKAFSDSLEKLKFAHQAVLDKAKAQGLPPPKVLPHPSDIVFDHDTYLYTLVGPFNERDTPFYDRWQAIQRLFVIWSEIARRQSDEEYGQTQLHLCAYAQVIDMQLPPSYQWSEFSWIRAIKAYRSMTPKVLNQELRTEVAKITQVQKSEKYHVWLPQRNLDVLNSMAAMVSNALEKAANYLEKKVRKAAVDLPRRAS